VPIIAPGLDDRRFDDLVEELLARIPAHTPEWTHPRQGDPGRTLIQVFAAGGHAPVAPRHSPSGSGWCFLKLLGQPLRPAGPACDDRALYKKDAHRQPAAPGGPSRPAFLARPQCCRCLKRTKRSLSDAKARLWPGAQGLVASAARGCPGLRDRAAVRRRRRRGCRRVPPARIRLWLALLAPEARRGDLPAFSQAALQALGGGDTGAPACSRSGRFPLSVPGCSRTSARAWVRCVGITTRAAAPRDQPPRSGAAGQRTTARLTSSACCACRSPTSR
jgi:hypothetical protein